MPTLMTVSLTDLQIRNAQAKEKSYRLRAGRGLSIAVMPDGAKYWRYRYRYASKAKMISLGVYPEVGIKEANQRAAEARALLLKGINPSEQRREQKLALRLSEERTFGHAAQLWYDHNLPRWRPATAEKVRQYLDKDVLPPLSKRPLANITPTELGDVVGKVEKRKALNVAKKVRQWLYTIFAFAIAKGLTTTNPAEHLGTVAAFMPESKNHAHLSIDDLPVFLQALDAYHGSQLTKACAWLALWTANRPGVTRTLKWSELDLDNGLWIIPKGREGMKRGYQHITPLPTQAVAALRVLHKVSGTYEYVFIGRNDTRLPISDGAVAGMLKKLGYDGKQTMHGFRHLISTALNEQGWDSDWVERQLAHGDPDAIRGTYNKAAYVDQRREMMQAWADHLDRLKSGKTNVVAIRKRKAS